LLAVREWKGKTSHWIFWSLWSSKHQI